MTWFMIWLMAVIVWPTVIVTLVIVAWFKALDEEKRFNNQINNAIKKLKQKHDDGEELVNMINTRRVRRKLNKFAKPKPDSTTKPKYGTRKRDAL